jgi:hypothetical protein
VFREELDVPREEEEEVEMGPVVLLVVVVVECGDVFTVPPELEV